MGRLRAPFNTMPATTVVRILPTGRPQIVSKTGITQVRTRLTADQAKDPAQVVRALSDLQSAIEDSTQPLRTDPEARAIYIRGVPFVGGATKTLTHNLGRPFTGYRVTRTYADASAAIVLRDGTLPSGCLPENSIALIANVSGTADIKIF